MTTLRDALAGVQRLGFDTAPIIYFIEAHPTYDALATDLFQRIDREHVYGVTSVVTLTEVMIRPLLNNDIHRQQEYRDLLLHSSHFETLPIHIQVAEEAARLRTRYGYR